jgi:putative transposase
MGKVTCAYDNSVVESFIGSMQIELLDRRTWTTRTEFATVIFEDIEAFYKPIRRHSAAGNLSPIDYEALHSCRQ